MNLFRYFFSRDMARAYPFVEQKGETGVFKNTTIYLGKIESVDTGPVGADGRDLKVGEVGVDVRMGFPGSIFCKDSTLPWSKLYYIEKYKDRSHMRLFGPMYMYGIADLGICIGFRRKVVDHFPEHLRP